MREFHRDDATRLQEQLHPGDEIVQRWDVGQDVVADQEVGLLVLGEHFPRSFNPEKSDQGWHTFLDRVRRDIGGGINAQHRD